MTDDAIRDRLWSGVWNLEYNATYGHEEAKFMLRRWMAFDVVARLLAALFASSSAIAGWALWKSDTGKHYWLILAGIAAVVSIIDSVFASQEKVKRYTELSSSFIRLSQTLKAVLDDMQIMPEFEIVPMKDRYDTARTRYSELLEAFPEDLLYTKRAANTLQDMLNERREYVNDQRSSPSPSSAGTAKT